MNRLVVCLFLIAGVFAQDCSTKVSQLELVLATDEQLWWGLQDIFFSGVNLSYKLSDATHFGVIDPLKTVADPQAYIQKANVVSAVPFTQTKNGAWLNSFALLDSTAGYNVFWAQGSSIGGLTSPSFQTVTPVLGEQTTQKCFGLDYVSSSKIIVDCYDSTTGINYFQVVTAEGTKQVEVADSLKTSTVTNRQVKVLRVQSILEEVVYIFRSHNDGNSVAPQSLIEVFTIDSTDNIVLFSILDTATVAIAMNDLSGKFIFDLIQMEVQENGMVYILDTNNVYRFSVTADGFWHLQGFIDLKAQKTYSMSINNQFDATGGYITNLVVLHLDTFVLYEWSLTSTTAKMTRVYETNTYVQTFPAPLFQVSQAFIFFQDPKTNNVRMYDTTSTSIILETGPVPSQWLINPYEGRIVSLDSQNAQAWAFQKGQLNYKSNKVVTTNLPLTITATSTVGGVQKECTSTLTYSVYEKKDFTLVKLADQSNPLVLPEEFLSEDTNIALRALVSGPNQQFQQLLTVVPKGFLRDDSVPNPSVILKSLQLQNLTLRAVESKFDDAQSVIFVETIALNDPNIFYEIIQNADLSVKIWRCVMVKELSSLSTCEISGFFTTAEKLTQKSLQTWFFFDQLLIGALTSKYELSVFVCDEGECKSVRTISYEAVAGQEIDSFVILNQYLWVVRANLKIIEIYNTFEPFTLMLTANAELALQNGYTGVWAPLQVFGNRILNPSTVMIDNGVELIVADYHTQLTLIKAIPYQLKSPQVSVSVASTTFFIAETDGTTSVLREFNYADLADIKLQKDVYLYWYQFQLPLQADFSALNGYFFIRALCTKTDKTFVLVFKPNTSQRDVLFQAINTGLKVDNGVSIIFSPSGNEIMYLYLNTKLLQGTWSLLNNPVVRVIPGNNTELVTYDAALDMVIKNFDMEGFNTVEYLSLVNVFNTNTDVTFDTAAFQKKSQSGLKINRGLSQTIPLQNDWFSGQVLYFKLQCRNCTSGNVHVKQRVNAEKLPFSLAGVTDFSPVPQSETFLAQAPSTLWFLKNMKQASPFLDMDLPEGVTCKLVSSVDSGLYVLSICMSSSQNYLHITSCIAQGQCFSAGLLEITGAAQIVKFAIAESTQAISIVVLSKKADLGSIIVYKLTTNGQIWALEMTQDLAGDYNAVDMILVQFLNVGDQYYKLILTDLNSGLFHMTGSNRVGGVLILESRGAIDLRTKLTELKQFISKSTQFLGISLFNITLPESSTQLILSTVVTTSNVAHFGLNLIFEIKDLNAAPFVDLSVLFNLNRYGKNKALNKLRVQNGTIIIAYASQVASDMIALCKYQIPIAVSPLKLALSTPVVNFDGGAEITTDGEDLAYMPLSIQTNATTGQNTLYTNQDSAYNFYDQAEIVVDDSTGVSNQELTIIAYNEQVGDSVQTTTQLDLENLEDESQWQWWYTLLIVIGAIALLAVIFACVRKNKGNDSVRESLLQVQQENSR